MERDYSTDDGPEPSIKFSDIRNDYKNFILPDREYSNTIYTSSTNLADENLTTHTIDTTLVGSASGTEYHLLINGRDTKRSDIKKPTKLKELISMTDSMRQYIKNTKVNSPKSYSEDGWSSFEWKTALYDLKSRKFKCADIDGNGNEITGIHYNESTGACLLYTSDAADDGYSVDLGGRRIIKKIFFKQKTAYEISEGLVGSEMCIRDSSYLNQEQKNPNNIWRADENTTGAYTGSSYNLSLIHI